MLKLWLLEDPTKSPTRLAGKCPLLAVGLLPVGMGNSTLESSLLCGKGEGTWLGTREQDRGEPAAAIGENHIKSTLTLKQSSHVDQ